MDELKDVEIAMAQPITSNSDSDAELEKELADILASDDFDNDDLDKSLQSLNLPNLSKLDLLGK